jgi:LAO/AO transport system kinase
MSKKKRPMINPKAAKRLSKKRKNLPPVSEMIDGILRADRVLLGQAITYIESEKPEHQQIARELIERCLPAAKPSVRIGITGSPGVGKSTFIEALGKHLLTNNEQLAVLAIDPTSQVSHGSILGDKTRMQELAAHPNAFIRPSPAGSSLGGVAQKTRETIILCEAAGYQNIFVETVGVGQSEIAVHSMIDCFVLLLLPGAGDDLQGIKRGIVEMADLLVVNKADSGREQLAAESRKAYKNALHLFPPKTNNWIPEVLTCSAQGSIGIAEVWQAIKAFRQHTEANGTFSEHRQEQARYWLFESINQQLQHRFYQHPKIAGELKDLEAKVLAGHISPFRAADALMKNLKILEY